VTVFAEQHGDFGRGARALVFGQRLVGVATALVRPAEPEQREADVRLCWSRWN
jgi:hypothetical protein